MEVKINLQNLPATDSKINVELQWNVEVTKLKPGLLARLLRKHNRINRQLRLNVTDIVVPDEVVCNREDLFSVLYDSDINPQEEFPVDVTITEAKMPFQLLFHQGEIKDCKRRQDANPRKYPITFTVKLTDTEDNEIHAVQEQIDLVFEPLNVKPQFKIHLDSNGRKRYSSSLKREKVGDLAIWIEEDFQFTPNQLATVTIKLYKGGQDVSNFISFENDSRKSPEVIQRGKKNAVKLPIYIDFTNISNPIEPEETYIIEATAVVAAEYSPNVRATNLYQKTFTLLKDLQGTELKVYTQEPGGTPVLCDSGHSPAPISYNFEPRSRLMKQITVLLTNIATDNSNNRAGLHISNLILQETVQDGVQVIGENNAILSRFVKIDGPGVDDMCSASGLFIPNGAKAQTALKLSFDPSNIVDVLNTTDYRFCVQSILSFDYYEDSNGLGIANVQPKQGGLSIKWNLCLEPNPEWLCVDYGSSAIVCKYDKTILDLKSQKDRIFRKAESGRFRDDNLEKGTLFLSSDVVLHPVRQEVRQKQSTLCSQQSVDAQTPYLNLSVCLSPTSSLVVNDARTQLPCLKILVGNEFLPEKGNYMTFEYSRLDETNILGSITAADAKKADEDTCVMRISSIFNEAYAALFRYFIQPVSKDKTINKLVLTYPNTYTPAHLRTLEKIVRQTFPKVRDGYLQFVGESDAVATYYINNWDRYNEGKDINKEETVLVYDMGAGTLDITLFKKSRNANTGKIEVMILGKIGTGKAGNYLDYVISDIIKVKLALNDMTVTTQPVPDVETQMERLRLKESVKNDVKPNLRQNKQLNCLDAEFDSFLIFNDFRFKAFLEDVTKGIIEKLLSYVGDKDMQIDTVLMSGRSCRLDALHNALKKALPNARILKIIGEGDREKTVVVEGAMARASIFNSPDSPVVMRSRRLYASYGLIYKGLGGSYHYTELLNSASLPFEEDLSHLSEHECQSVQVEGILDNTVTLIQTYLSPKDTEKAYNEGDMEFISVMEEYNTVAFNGATTINAKLMLDYRNNISLYVNGLASKGSPPKGTDLNSEITKRSIWPVTM